MKYVKNSQNICEENSKFPPSKEPCSHNPTFKPFRLSILNNFAAKEVFKGLKV